MLCFFCTPWSARYLHAEYFLLQDLHPLSISLLLYHYPLPGQTTVSPILKIKLRRSNSISQSDSTQSPFHSCSFVNVYSRCFLREVSLFLSPVWISTQTLDLVRTPKLFRPEDTRVSGFSTPLPSFLLDVCSSQALDPTAADTGSAFTSPLSPAIVIACCAPWILLPFLEGVLFLLLLSKTFYL